MDYKSFIILIIFLFNPKIVLSDWIQKGKLIRVISGNTIEYYDNSEKKIKKYQLPCVNAYSSQSNIGKFQKKTLEKLISGKEITGVIRSHLDKKTGITLADIFIVERVNGKEHYKSVTFLLVRKKILKKSYIYSGCWPEDEK